MIPLIAIAPLYIIIPENQELLGQFSFSRYPALDVIASYPFREVVNFIGDWVEDFKL